MSDGGTVFKYEIHADDQWHEIAMPLPARVVHVASPQNVPGKVNVWAEVTPGSPDTNARGFRIYGTGQPVPDSAVYVGTALAAPFVWHVYAAPLRITEAAA